MSEPILGIRRYLAAHDIDYTTNVVTPHEPIAVRGYTGEHELFRCTVEYRDGFHVYDTDETYATREYLEALPRERDNHPDPDRDQ